jgi:hypothetical protein
MPDTNHISRVIQRKRDCIILGVWTTVEGKRIGADVACPRDIDDDQIKTCLDFGEAELRKAIAAYLAQNTLSKFR